MTKQEEREFLEIASTKPDNHYEALGLIPFSEFNLDNYNDRKNYANNEITDSAIKNNALKYINFAKSTLTFAPKKKLYDTELRQSLKTRLVRLIKNAVKDDSEFSKDERDLVESNGKHFGFTDSEIRIIIEEQRKIYEFTDSSGTKEIETASKTTKAGSPKLEIHNNTNFTKNGEFLFDNVKLTETRREVITIKNGGGGTLDATAVFSAKWIEVIPKKIHQSKLPQDITIIIDPSKDKSLKNGSGGIMDTINLTYASSGGTIRKPIVVKMAVEGHHSLVKRQSKYATIVSSILAGLTLLYIFSNYDFSGWAIFGFVVSAIAIGWAAFLAIENEREMGGLIIGGIILLITNWTIFALLSTVIITFYAAKFIFHKNPFRNELIAAIPIGSFALFLMLFFGASNLRYSNYNYNNYNTKTRTQTQPTYNPVRQINRDAYISANPIANIRSGTSTDYSVITSIDKGEKVYLINQDKATNWYKVKFFKNNTSQYGYISHKVISFNYISKNSNTQSTGNNSTTRVNKNTLSKSTLIGSWKIDNGNSKYTFNSNGRGNYKNSRGKDFSFRWSVNNNYLKITLNSDNSVWNWKINSFSNNRITMYSSKRKLNRTITKY